MKEIAASTTSTGRQMLLFAKHFIEFMYKDMINFALENKDKYLELMNNTFECYQNKLQVNEVYVEEINKKERIYIKKANITVNTVEKQSIPLSKFSRNEMGFEPDTKFYEKHKKIFKIFGYEYSDKKYFEENYEKEFKNTENSIYTKEKDFYEMFTKSLLEYGVMNRRKFYNDLKEIVIGKKNKKTKFYEKHKICMEKMGIITVDNYKKIFKSINSLEETEKEDFIMTFHLHIKNIGFTNKKEMFEKMYELYNEIIDEYTINPEVIYGDTDSVFFRMNITDKNKNQLKDKIALVKSIELGILSSILICLLLPAPMAMEYEKVLWPFAIFSKKRYVGNLYERNPNSFYQKSMGIVLKRRDNAPIVKIVCGGIIDYILNKQDPIGAYKFTEEILRDIYGGKFKLDKFIITKTLRSEYKNRDSIVHAVLADRIAKRDPGNKPQSNDRVPFAYVETLKEVKLQGERVENPEYIKEKNLKTDYLFYITNQIMKPAVQFLELVIEKPEELFKYYNNREENRRKNMMPMGYYNDQTTTCEFNNKEEINFYTMMDNAPEVDNLFTKNYKNKNNAKNKLLLNLQAKQETLKLDDTLSLFNFNEINDLNNTNNENNIFNTKKNIIGSNKKKIIRKIKKEELKINYKTNFNSIDNDNNNNDNTYVIFDD
jgi:hypothetical protein